MKIQVLSDLHIEHSGFFSIPDTDADVIVLAGDIAVGIEGVSWAKAESERLGKFIIYVAGNHEYYSNEYHTLLKDMRNLAATSPLLHFLEKDEVVINGVRFLGTTLWTDYSAGPESQQDAMAYAESCMNDHRIIMIGKKRFKPMDAFELHMESVMWLEDVLLSKPFPGKTVVITHHGPSPLCYHVKFGDKDPLSPAFYSNLGDLVSRANLWVYGHTHSNLDVNVKGCRLVSNQAGYPREDVPGGFNPELVIDLEN